MTTTNKLSLYKVDALQRGLLHITETISINIVIKQVQSFGVKTSD